MKKFLLILIMTFCALNFTKSVSAQENTVPIPSIKEASSTNPTPATIDYKLPYPGILPGSPLYTLKLIRDGISDLLISDPVDKSKFYLEQSDKRLAAFIVLQEEGEYELSNNTFSKGLDYFEKSIEKIEEAKEEKRSVEDIYGKISTSSEKQKEEIEKIIEQKNGKISEKLSENQKRVIELEKKVKAFSS